MPSAFHSISAISPDGTPGPQTGNIQPKLSSLKLTLFDVCLALSGGNLKPCTRVMCLSVTCRRGLQIASLSYTTQPERTSSTYSPYFSSQECRFAWQPPGVPLRRCQTGMFDSYLLQSLVVQSFVDITQGASWSFRGRAAFSSEMADFLSYTKAGQESSGQPHSEVVAYWYWWLVPLESDWVARLNLD